MELMTVSVHEVLVHGAAVVVRHVLLLPLGMLSGSRSGQVPPAPTWAQQARNKDVRSYRLHRARKDSCLHNIADQLSYLLVTSDPKISSVNIGATCQLREAAATSNASREVFVEPAES